jgi:hypothetical protein
MHKIIVILLSLIIYFSACRIEDPKQEKPTEKTSDPIVKYCYLNEIKHIDGNYLAAVDFIEYKKVTEIDSLISSSKIIELPNGFCYLNKKQFIEDLELHSNAGILMQTFSYSNEGNFEFNQALTLEELYKSYNDPQFLRLKSVPFKVVISGSKIDSLFEIYIP